MATLVTESWTGTNGTAWPAQWSTTSAATCFIQSNQGRINPGAAAWTTAKALLAGVNSNNTDVLVDFTVGARTEQYPTISVRAGTTDYGADANLPAYGYTLVIDVVGNGVQLHRIASSTSKSQLATASLTLTAGTVYRVRLREVSGLVQARIWPAANAEPNTWLLSITDGSPLTSTGTVRLSQLNGPAATAQPVDFDNFSAAINYGTSTINLRVGTDTPSGFYAGGSTVSAMYVGTTQVFGG